jgi:hypothetical protein
MPTEFLLLAGLAVIVVLVLGVVLYRWSRSRALRRSFGPEYTHAVETTGDRKLAERELAERRKRVEHYQLRELADGERRDLAARWRGLQIDFVDRPQQTVESADRLVVEVMTLRGYPPGDFRQRLADTSVGYPQMAADYRQAREIAERSRQGVATTEELRRAMVCYRNLFAALLGADEIPSLVGGTQPLQGLRR